MIFNFDNFPNEPKYKTVVIDPPWPVTKVVKKSRPNQTKDLDYTTMDIDDIFRLPIQRILNPDGANVFLWTTNTHLEQAFKIFNFWGIRFHCLITWCKSSGVSPFSPFLFMSEYVLYGTTPGGYTNVSLGVMRTWINHPTTKHSEKPEMFFIDLATYFPAPRINLFARKCHKNFTSWGDQLS